MAKIKPQEKPVVKETLPTPGAGVDPSKVINGRNRLIRAWKEYPEGRDAGLGLKSYARVLADNDTVGDLQGHALTWLVHKEETYVEERKARRTRVQVGKAASRRSTLQQPQPSKKGKNR